VCTCVAGDESLIEDEVRQKAASPPGRVPHLTLRLYACTGVVSLSAALCTWPRGRWADGTLDVATRRTTRSPE
jgi:hypothetical protein